MTARKVPLNYRNITGYVHSNKSNAYTHFESSLERDALLICEFDPAVKAFSTQPRRFNFTLNGKSRHYTPDILIEYHDGRKVYVEIKYRDNLKKDWLELKPKFKAAIHELKNEPNTRFKILTEIEIRTVFLKNITFLLPYKSRAFEEYQLETIRKILLRGQPMTILELLSLCSTSEMEQAEFLNTLWYAVSHRIVQTDLASPLSMENLVWLEDYGLEEDSNE